MSLVPLGEILQKAEEENYAVGYFESWNLESLQAVWEPHRTRTRPTYLDVFD